MASTQGLLPASKEVVLQIQLNKLIHDFLFSGAGDDNTSSACNGVDAEGVQNASCIVQNQSQNTDAKPWKMDNHLSLLAENAQFSENVRINVGKKDVSSCVADLVDDECASTPLSNLSHGCSSMPFDHNNNKGCPPTGDVRVDIHEQTPNLCSVNNSDNANKLKVFRLSKSLSVGGSVFCFAMQRQGEFKEKEGNERAPGSSVKLTRIGSLPCYNKAHNEVEKGFKHTCKKPPRPPRSPLEKTSDKMLSRQATSDAIFVLHGTSRRARFERRKRNAGSFSSSAPIWALIFTLLFALVMLGEGFWSQNSAWIPSNSSTSSGIDTTKANDMKPNLEISSMEGRTNEGGLYVSSQLEKEMQMREFWISKGLDPT